MGGSKNIIFFDGNCMLCNSFIAYLIKKNCASLFFCDINSSNAKQLLGNFSLPCDPQNTIYFLYNNQLFAKSTAVLKIVSQLGFLFKIITRMLLVVPTLWRDAVYSLVAKNRYRFFKQSVCYTPTPEQKDKFL